MSGTISRKEALQMSRSILEKAEMERIDMLMEDAKKSECADCKELRSQRDALVKVLEDLSDYFDETSGIGEKIKDALNVVKEKEK